MIRSRRFAFATLAVVFGLSACGDPNTTAPLAEQPVVIELASGQSGGAVAAPAAELDAASAVDSKMAFMAITEFVYDGELPALDDPSGSWFFATGQQADLDRIAALAASFGVEGEVRTLSADQGGGWAVGPEDYSASVLSVGSDGMLTWYFSGPQTGAVDLGCATSGIAVDPVAGSGVAGGAGTATDAVAVPETMPAATKPAIDVVPPDVVAPECVTPQPPVGVPTKDEALAEAKQLFADWGYDVSSYQFDDAYADEWGANVNASLMLDGMKAPVVLSAGFGENGALTYASGYLAVPERGADYPTIGAAAGLERLQTQQNQYIGFGDPAILRSTDDVASQPAVGAPEIAPCEPESARADCAPADIEPFVVTLNSVKADLTMVWAADNTIWLLPAYTFGSTDQGLYTVIAVDDAYIHQADPAIATTEPVTEPGAIPVPDTAPAAGGDTACAQFEAPTADTDPGIQVEFGQRWIGQCLSFAEAEASYIGFSVRVVRQDGVDLPVTDDFSDRRFNVAVDGEIVTEIISIG